MADVKISQLPAGTANANAVVPATNAAGTQTQKVTLGAIAALGGGPPAAHVHGNVTNDGKIGSTSGLPVVTGAAGVLQAGSCGSSAGTVCQGNDPRLSDARTPTSHNHAASDINSGTLDAARLPAATTTASGAVEIATVAETLAGTDTTRSVTPESVGFSRRAGGRAKFWEIFCDFAPDASGIDTGTDGAIFSPYKVGAGSDANIYANQSVSFTNPTAGILTLSTGTTTTGVSAIYSWNSRPHRFDTGTTTFETLLRIPSLATAGDDYVLRVGYFAPNAIGNDAIGFEYDRSSSANWQYVSGLGATYTRVNSGKSVEAAKWIKLRMVFTSSSATFCVNDANAGTITTNIQANGAIQIATHIIKTAGTTSRSVLLDYIFARHDFNSDRTFTT